jgi:hypothetical protein
MRLGRVVALGAGIVTLGLVAGTNAVGASRPTLNSARPHIVYGTGVALSGRAPAGRRIVVQADPFPFTEGFHTIATTKASGSGRFHVAVRPTHATRYRAILQSVASRVITVYVTPRDTSSCNICGSIRPGTYTLVLEDVWQYPPGPIEASGPEYVYYGLDSGTTAVPVIHLVKTVPLLRLSGNRLSGRASFRVHFPSHQFHWNYVTCYRDVEARDGIGLPGHHHCGDSSLTVAEYKSYLG